MKPDRPQFPYLATPLHERLHGIGEDNQVAKASCGEALAGHLAKWHTEAALHCPSLFQQFLRAFGLNKDKFATLLGESPADLCRRLPAQRWFDDSHLLADADGERTHVDFTQLDDRPHRDFLVLLEPLLEQLASRLEKCIDQHSSANPSLLKLRQQIVQNAIKILIARLVPIVERALVFEMHALRLQGKLAGYNPEGRFASFIDLLKSNDFRNSFFEEYPVVVRQVLIACRGWLAAMGDFIDHLTADWPDIARFFDLDPSTAALTSIAATSGDCHDRGKVVLVAGFGGSTRVIYKPRDLRLDEKFYSLVQWFNDRATGPSFYVPKLLPRETHGWMEFVGPRDCADQAEIDAYYGRYGGLVAIAYMLGSVDLHLENVIAFGSHPVVVDLETILQPGAETAFRSELGNMVTGHIEDSVLSTGMLPMRSVGTTPHESLDLSGLSEEQDRHLPSVYPYWRNAGTDQMSMEYGRAILKLSNNTPALNGRRVRAKDFVEQIVEGYRQIWAVVRAEHRTLIEDPDLLGAFYDQPNRVILRQTAIYGHLLQESYHPQLLRDALDRDRNFSQLWHQTKINSWLSHVIIDETRQLWEGDIPIFRSTTSSRDLHLSTGEIKRDFFAESGWERLQRRLRSSAEDHDNQDWLIRASVCSMADDPHSLSDVAAPAAPHRMSGADAAPIDWEADMMVECALDIARRLDRRSLSTDCMKAWMGLTPSEDGRLILHATNLDLYSGLPGILIFYTHLFRVTGDEVWARTARTVYASLLSVLAERPLSALPLGGYNGCGGLIYALQTYTSCFPTEDAHELIAGLTREVGTRCSADDELDVVGGIAGAAICLIRYHGCYREASALDAAVACAEVLRDRAVRQEHGVGWIVKGMRGARPLTGVAHGNAGIGWALWETAHASGRQDFRELAEFAFAYERSLFSKRHGNWPDLRDQDCHQDSGESAYFMGWCHGAPGIGLARLACQRVAPAPEFETEVRAAVETVLASEFGNNHCLCHGDLGNLDFLLSTHRSGQFEWLREPLQDVTNVILSHGSSRGWRCGVPCDVDVPGLMNGLSGIGLQLLRLARPEDVPSVLLFDVPQPIRQEDETRHASAGTRH